MSKHTQFVVKCLHSSLCDSSKNRSGECIGWIGGISQYRGHLWELHPLVVRVSQQGQGIGRALVADLEERVKERDGLTITLGTDDVTQQTTLAGINLFPMSGNT
jgi:GNAT superfamily N-acetyltransferase